MLQRVAQLLPAPLGKFLLSSGLGKLMGPVGVRGLAVGLSFLQSIIVARVFGPESYGAFSFAISIGALLLLFVSFGFDNLLIRELASTGPDRARTSSRWRHVATFSGKIVWALLLCACAGTIIAALLLADGTPYQTPLIIVACALPFVTLRKFIEALAVGAKQIVRSMWGTQVIYPLLMILLALGFLGLPIIRSAATLSLAYLLASVVSVIFALLLLRQLTGRIGRWLFPPFRPAVPEPGDDLPSQRTLLFAGGNLALVAGALMMGQHLDVIMTGMFASSAEVAIVRVCSRIAEIIGIVRMVLIIQYKPILAEDFALGDQVRLQGHVRQLVSLFALTSLPIFLVVFVFASPVLSLFGPEFVTGVWVLRLYMIGILLTIFAGPVTTVLSMCNHEKAAAGGLWVAVAVNFIGGIILIPRYGAIGAALGNLASMLVLALVCTVLVKKHIGIRPTIFEPLRLMLRSIRR